MCTIKEKCWILGLERVGLPVPVPVVDGSVLVASIGATVAAATGVTVLKIGFCVKK